MFGTYFTFSPSEGTLEIGEQKIIKIIFNSGSLGYFKEQFYCSLTVNICKICLINLGCIKTFKYLFSGNRYWPSNYHLLTLKTFNFNVDKLDLGLTSYGFSTMEKIELCNTSSVPLCYRLRCNVVDSDDASDFLITPQEGSIDPLSSSSINLQFTPKNIRVYECELVVDVEGVGNDLYRLPVFSQSIVPKIELEQIVLNISDCFLDYVYDHEICLINNTSFPAKFELIPQEEFSKTSFIYTSKNGNGTIYPFSKKKIPLEIQIRRLGILNSNILVKIIGNGNAPLCVDILANGIGPEVTVSASEINWGKIEVLTPANQVLKLYNNSPVAANFTCGILSEIAAFSVEPLSGKIAPGSSCEVILTAFLEDTVKFTDFLKIHVHQATKNYEIKLMARGEGTTIVFSESLKFVDFGDVFSNCECVAEFIISNKGKRSQNITFFKEEKSYHSSTIPIASQKDMRNESHFEVIPGRFTLKPGSQQTIIIKGTSLKATTVREKICCQTVLEKDPQRRVIIETIVSANFIYPYTRFKPEFLKFEVTHDKEEKCEIVENPLALTNTTSLPIHVSIFCPIPFCLKTPVNDICLKPNETLNVTVLLDADYNHARISTIEHAKLTISYQEHPQKDLVDIFSEINFPNLNFSTNSLKFGCISADIEQRKSFQIKNSSKIPVFYHWYFIEDKYSEYKELPQIFDIQPLRGCLDPGDCQEVEVYFYGQAQASVHQKFLCDVRGGPKYDLDLQGDASYLSYTFDKSVIDFGNPSYTTQLSQEITLHNSGLVKFDYRVVILPNSALIDKIVVVPSKGVVKPKESLKINGIYLLTLIVFFCALVPEKIDSAFYIKIAYNEPAEIKIKAVPTFPRLSIDLPSKNGPSNYKCDELLLQSQTKALLDNVSHNRKHVTRDAEKDNYIGSHFLQLKPKTRSKEVRVGVIVDSSQVIHKEYICDLGTVIKNSTTKKMIQVKNSGHQPISFSLDRSILANTGFNIEPEKVKGLPEGESQDFQLLFNAKNSDAVVELLLPIYILGGPKLIIKLKVKIELPEICFLHSQTIDFEEVLTGYRKIITTEIQNTSNVPCEWCIKVSEEKEMKSSKLKKEVVLKNPPSDFEVMPSCGALAPLEKIKLTVIFTPTESKFYDMTFPIKVIMTQKTYGFRLCGKGIKPEIKFIPGEILPGIISPFADPVECKFFVENQINYPLELYSVENDLQHVEESEIIRSLDGFKDGFIYLPPRKVGTSLTDYLLENGLLTKKNNENLDELLNSLSTPAVGDLFDAKAKVQEGIHKDQDNEGSGSINLIIHGPPLSGKTTQSKRIAQKFDKLYINLDEVIEQTKKKYVNAEGQMYSVVDSFKFDDEDLDFVAEILRLKLNKPEARKGVVIDGLESKYYPNIVNLCRIISKVFAERNRKVILLNFSLDPVKIRERESIQLKASEKNELEALFVKELSEEEYDLFDEEKRNAYDKAVRFYKKKIKEIEEKKRARRNFEEGLLQNRLGERKPEDEKAKPKKSRAPTQTKATEKTEKPVSKSEQKPPKQRKGTDKKIADRGDKVENSEKEKEKSDRVVEKEDEVPKLVLEETFFNEALLKRTEAYLSTLEATFASIKENEKPGKYTPMVSEKKNKGNKGLAEDDTMENVIDIHEVNVNALDVEGLFKILTELIPTPIAEEEVQVKSTNEVTIEQIFSYPPIKVRVPPSKVFQLAPLNEILEEQIVENPVVLPVLAVPFSVPGMIKVDLKNDLKKINKLPNKIMEEKTVEIEEEPEKELPAKYRWILVEKF